MYGETYWETAVYQRGFFGAFKPSFFIVNIAAGDELIRKIQNQVKEFVEKCSPVKWPHGGLGYSSFVSGYVDEWARTKTVVPCQGCGTKLSLPAGRRGQVKCPRCNGVFEATT
jgi:LSD1 subclass zinc finger protein